MATKKKVVSEEATSELTTETEEPQAEVEETKEETQETKPTETRAQTPEEIEWSKLSGDAQDRFKRVIQERNALREQVENSFAPPPPPPSYQSPLTEVTGEITPEQQEAIDTLRKFGVVTKKDLEEIETKTQEEMLLNTEYSRLETLHSGDDGLPRFDRTIIEEHMRETGIYNPEKAYDDLYRDELFDHKYKSSLKSEEPEEEPVYRERPSSSVGAKTQPLTVDSIRERLQQPDGMVWWEKNRDKILPLMKDLTTQ